MKSKDRYVIGRERNVVRVNFRRPPDPPTPKFPGAAAVRATKPFALPLDASQLGKEDSRRQRYGQCWHNDDLCSFCVGLLSYRLLWDQ
jgi:hypothetical protein